MMPKKWNEFLCVNENKQALLELIAEGLKSTTLSPDQEVHVMHKGAWRAWCQSGHTMPNCTHEEADTRLFLLAQDAVLHGCKRVCIRTVDSDVVVIATSLFPDLPAEELWLVLGTSLKPKLIGVHEMVVSLDLNQAKYIPCYSFMHSLAVTALQPLLVEGRKPLGACGTPFPR
jgi:hypothetical protein